MGLIKGCSFNLCQTSGEFASSVVSHMSDVSLRVYNFSVACILGFNLFKNPLEETGSLEIMNNIQWKLSVAQAVPFVGPVFVSPIKQGLSVLEVGFGLVALAAVRAYATCFPKVNVKELEAGPKEHVISGCYGFCSSSLNIVTGGYSGLAELVYGAAESIAYHLTSSTKQEPKILIPV